MTKTTLILLSIGSFAIFSTFPLHILFGVVYVFVVIEMGELEQKPLPIIRTIFLSSFFGWVTSFFFKHIKPEWFNGDIRIFTRFVITLFAYVTAVYLLKSKTIQKLAEKYLNKKVK